jgi:RHS repeat-associated protein
MSDIDRYQYGYDLNSNRTYKADVVAHAAGVYLDETYAYDSLNRLTGMQRGNLSGGSIAGTPAREMDYTLDPTGNWSAYLTKTNGSTDLSQNRSSNAVNEITAFTGTPLWSTPPSYDAAGNMTVFPQPATPGSSYTATYDAWNRMVGLTNTSGGSAVATYQYDGRGRRVVKTTPTETRHFYYTNSWQDVEERVGTAATMDKQYVWGVRYVDELVCRDDADNAALPRLYATQDANFNLMRVCNASGGAVVERYVFDPYGTRTVMNASWGAITASVCQWVLGHQGLMQDAESGLIYNRQRFLHASVGVFCSRDELLPFIIVPAYAYLAANPLVNVDPLAFQAAVPAAPAAPPAPKLKPAAGIPYILQLIGNEEAKFKNCWIYQPAGIDKMFASITAAAKQYKTALLAPGGKALGTFDSGTFNINPNGWPDLTAVHESVHAFNYLNGYHQGGFLGWGEGDAEKADEGMAWGVEDMLGVVESFCDSHLTNCKSCDKAQQLYDTMFKSLRGLEGSQAGNSKYPDTLNRTHIWDINAKLGLRFSASTLAPEFEKALKNQGLNCTITRPQDRGKDAFGQPDPFF